jgi:GNAT superfamily N-acetyltransferase
MGVPIRRAGEADRGTVAGILDAGFFHDPVSSWIFPEEEYRRRTHKVLMSAFLDMALRDGYVDMTDEASAVALWFPVDGGHGADDGKPKASGDPEEPPGPGEPRESGESGVDDAIALREAIDPANERIEQIARITGEAHPTHAPHDYLMLIAVVPGLTGRGLGTALLTAALDRLDRASRPAYLEASSTRSRALYERLGFRPTGGTIQLPGGPPMHPLWRPPQPAV